MASERDGPLSWYRSGFPAVVRRVSAPRLPRRVLPVEAWDAVYADHANCELEVGTV